MVFDGEGHSHPDALTGDLIIKVGLKRHPKFRREGADLFMDLKITLKESLLGKKSFFSLWRNQSKKDEKIFIFLIF